MICTSIKVLYIGLKLAGSKSNPETYCVSLLIHKRCGLLSIYFCGIWDFIVASPYKLLTFYHQTIILFCFSFSANIEKM